MKKRLAVRENEELFTALWKLNWQISKSVKKKMKERERELSFMENKLQAIVSGKKKVLKKKNLLQNNDRWEKSRHRGNT